LIELEQSGMGDGATATAFAPAERAPDVEIERQSKLLADLPLLPVLFDAVSAVVLIVNRQRQVVYANGACLKLLGFEHIERVRGLRPGEAMHCAHADDMEAGCGTAEPCQTCGAVLAVLASQRGKPDARECRITRKHDREPLDLLVWATPFPLTGEMFSIVALTDISHEKRRQALERIFFHDILNDAGALQGFVELLCAAEPDEALEFREDIHRLTHKLVDEIEAQRALSLAENDELEPRPRAIHSRDLLVDVVNAFRRHPVAEGREIVLDPESFDVPFMSDGALVRRVLGNMVKNALEASQPGQAVTLRCEAAGDAVTLSVHNPAFMPRDVQLQIFQRSFSTKGGGRGLGTYSMKLLGERYLKGEVAFTSSPGKGTTFFAQFPLDWRD
jgi:nitrogen-specific signal transduction histidine kinase